MQVNRRELEPRAAAEVIDSTLQHDYVEQTRTVHNRRHYILETHLGNRYYVIWKRELYLSFGETFGYSGPGESVDVETVQYAMRRGITNFVFVYPSGRVYVVPVREVFNFATKNDTIRDLHSSGDRVMSFPIKMEHRWKG